MSLQEVHSLLEKEAVRCIFIQDNPTFDSLRTSLGLPPSQLASASQHAEHQLALKVSSHSPRPRPIRTLPRHQSLVNVPQRQI